MRVPDNATFCTCVLVGVPVADIASGNFRQRVESGGGDGDCSKCEGRGFYVNPTWEELAAKYHDAASAA